MRVPKYKEVVDALAAQLRGGRWPAGTRLPTHRQLAAAEGIAVVTASRVYAERRVAVSTADPFATTPTVPHALRLAVGSVPLPDLRNALRTVHDEIHHDTQR